MPFVAAPAWAVDLWVKVKPFYDRIAVWHGYEDELRTLAIYGIGIALYAAVVYTFYTSVARRRTVPLQASAKPGWPGRMSRTLERGLLFPLTSFVYFAFLAVSLMVLSKETTTTGNILLVAMAVVVGVRVAVYLSEGISNDLSKLVPLSLLGVLLVDPGYLKLATAWTRFGEAIQMWPLLARYFLLFIALESVMGITRATILRIGRASKDLRGRVASRRSPPKRPEDTTFTVEVKTPAKPPAAPRAPADPPTVPGEGPTPDRAKPPADQPR